MFQVTFHNNSDHVAYNIRVLSEPPGFGFAKVVNQLKPIKAHDDVTYSREVRGIVPIAADEVSEPRRKLAERKFPIYMVIQYQNSKGRQFYTVYDGSKEGDSQNELRGKFKIPS